MGDVTRVELIERTGVSEDFLDRLISLGLVATAGSDPGFSSGDIRRVLFLHALDKGAMDVEAVAVAVRNGDLSFNFFDASYFERFGGLTSKTLRELGTETGMSFDMLAVIRESMGFARPDPDDLVREDELDQVALVKTTLAAGVDPVAMERQLRVWSESVRRIADADSNFYHTQFEVPLLRAGLSESQMMEVASESAKMMAPLLDQALVSMYHAQSEHTWTANIVEAVEATLEKKGLYRRIARPPAICFLDLTGYTRLTEESGDEAAAQLAASLTREVYRGSRINGGRPVKWLGDGVMIFFEAPGSAVAAALDMVEHIPSAGLPPAHVGIAAGPVIFQDGDYYGRTVNLAARIAGRAGAGQVLVSEDVVSTAGEGSLEFSDIGLVDLKGLTQPIRLHQASRA